MVSCHNYFKEYWLYTWLLKIHYREIKFSISIIGRCKPVIPNYSSKALHIRNRCYSHSDPPRDNPIIQVLESWPSQSHEFIHTLFDNECYLGYLRSFAVYRRIEGSFITKLAIWVPRCHICLGKAPVPCRYADAQQQMRWRILCNNCKP